MTSKFAFILFGSLAVVSLSACGNKGALFLAENPPPSELPPSAPEPTGTERVITPPDAADAPTETNDTPPPEATRPKPP